MIILGALAGGIALGKVNRDTTEGLEPIITTMAALGGAFAGWAFRERTHEELLRHDGAYARLHRGQMAVAEGHAV